MTTESQDLGLTPHPKDGKFISVRCDTEDWSNSNWIFSFNISGIIYSVKYSTVESINFYNIIVFNATLLSINTFFFFTFQNLADPKQEGDDWWIVL